MNFKIKIRNNDYFYQKSSYKISRSHLYKNKKNFLIDIFLIIFLRFLLYFNCKMVFPNIFNEIYYKITYF